MCWPGLLKAARVTVDTAGPATAEPHGASSGLHGSQAAPRRCPEHIQQQLVLWLPAGELCFLPGSAMGIRVLELLLLLKEELEAQMFWLFCAEQVKVTRSLLHQSQMPGPN